MRKIGIITEKGTVITDDHNEYNMPVRGVDNESYPEVLIDAKAIGGDGWMYRQSIKPYIGMKCTFIVVNEQYGYNFEIIKE